MIYKVKIAFSWRILCTICMVFLLGTSVSAQKIDTTKLSIKPKAKIINKTPQIKANIPAYKPTTIGYTPTVTSTNAVKQVKILSVLKVYPNPVSDQINISMRLERETMLSVKITDLLGNDVVSLANERCAAGEQTKSYPIPNKLNPGIYFLRILAGGEPTVRRISVF